MNIKLKLALLRQSSEEGAVLPVILGMGLIMTLTGMTMIIRSSDEQLTAVSQTQTAQAQSTAEAGITRVQSILNRYRPFTLLNRSDWAVALTIANDPTVTGICNADPNTADAINTLLNRQPIDSSNLKKGYFDVKEYNYTSLGLVNPSAGQVIGNGELIVAGDLGGQTIVASDSISRIAVNIPVLQTDPRVFPIPGTWLTGGDMQSRLIEANLIYSGGCDITTIKGGVTGTNPRTGEAYKSYTLPSLRFPDLPTRPNTLTTGSTSISVPENYYNALVAGSPYGAMTDTITIPQSADDYSERTVTNNGVTEIVREYRYRVSDITLQGSRSLIVTPGRIDGFRKKVFVYVDRNILLNNTSSVISHSCAGLSETNCKPTDLQFFQYGTYSNDINTGGRICLSGSANAQMFMFSPFGRLSANGSTSITGSLWVREIAQFSGCTFSGGSGILVSQNAEWSELGNALAPRGIPPTISPISQWERK